jgi:uncharacterized protein (TIGR02453 family)
MQQFDMGLYPPFEGFPQEGMRFLKNLKRNNNRQWFAKHKAEYEDFLKIPMKSLIFAIKPAMARLAPEIDVNPERSMFRIYRDTRFSPNKTPYKTHVAAVFHLKGHWQESAGFYLHVEPGGVYLGGGIYMPDGRQLKKIRGAIAERGEELLSILGSRAFTRRFGTLEGDKLQRNPLGFPKDHPMMEFLKYKQFLASVTWKEDACTRGDFAGKIVEVYRDLLPLIRYLNQALNG